LPEGDTILWAATRIRPVLEGRVPDEIVMPAPARGAIRGSHGRERWPPRLRGRAITRVDTHGKNLFVRFEGELVLHSHLRMTGAWGVFAPGERWYRARSRAWIVLRHGGHEVVEFDGPVLELLTESRARFDQRLAGLGPDVLAAEFDGPRFLRSLRHDDPTRTIGDALLDQRNIAGIGNIWKSEGCWEAGVDPWRPVRSVGGDDALAIVAGVRPRMLASGLRGPRSAQLRVYRRERRPCPRCGAPISARPQGDGNRMTYWCPGCQS
jgi:endonuclease-8